MFYKYESTLDNDLIFWSNATADLRHNGEIGEDDLPDELLHALNELWTDGHLVSCSCTTVLWYTVGTLSEREKGTRI